MDLPALRTVPFLHGTASARLLRANPCWHRNGLAFTDRNLANVQKHGATHRLSATAELFVDTDFHIAVRKALVQARPFNKTGAAYLPLI